MPEEKTAPQAEETTASKSDEAQTTETEKSPQTEATTEENKPQAEQPKKSAWFTRVIAREAAEKREAKREAEQYKRQNADLLAALAEKGTDPSKPKADTSILSQAEVDRQANEKANAILFNRDCDRIAEEGNDAYEDFQESIGVLQSLGDGYANLVHVAVDMPDAHKILYHLGKNPDEAERLLSLPPTKMAIGLSKLEGELSKGKSISKAPAPLNPIKPKSTATFDPDDHSRSDPEYRRQWSEWREKTRRKR